MACKQLIGQESINLDRSTVSAKIFEGLKTMKDEQNNAGSYIVQINEQNIH